MQAPLAPLLLLLPPLLLLLLLQANDADGHGRLIEPPSRSSMWRYGFDTPPDYNDHELYCGGFSRQWERNKGRCGICGDPWDTPQLHEAGGTYGTGTLVRKYLTATTITIRIELTANHRGYFEFRLCPVNDHRHDATQDRHVLQRASRGGAGAEGADTDGEVHETRYYPGPGNKVFASRYRLPEGLTCKHCVLQWRYIAGNNWGMCPNGTGAVGCGPQEEFRACADVAVVDSAGEADGTPLAPGDEDVDEHVPADATPTPAPRDSGSGLLVLLIVLCALAGSATVLSLLYLYFYHAGDRVKSWLAAHRKSTVKSAQQTGATVPPPGPPAPPPRHKRPSNMGMGPGPTIVC
ncbi:hypothetical protein ONE63_010995 [Megalurothrips usitatus]|uniref:Chitin-binding type-4 domain-containing protein n=1 Tax=Megalurothrips usitatus TaxID=439358 RepID=A0AAV7XJC4_9NEOP|nr:hypothetical protein ONE63_010995 [Megalurothrips usitatus]